MDPDRLYIDSCQEKDQLTQRCRMNFSLISSLGLNVGDYVAVTPDDNSKTVICSVHPLYISESINNIEIDESVVINRKVAQENSKHVEFPSGFSPLKACIVRNVKVSVVLNDIEAASKWKKNKIQLEYWVKCFIQWFGVVKNSVISCISNTNCTSIAKLCKLYAIIIEELDCDENYVGKINKETEITINKMISRKRYELNRNVETISLGGLQKEYELLINIITIPYKYNNFEICPKGILLIGPSGTGKSMLVRKVCQECRTHLIKIGTTDFCKSGKGENEALLKKIFNQAEMFCEEGPCVLLIDNIDDFCSTKNMKGYGSNGLLKQFHELMDDMKGKRRKLIVIGETNRPNNIELAMRRPGRFDEEILIGVPNRNQRIEIMKALTESFNLSETIDLCKIADRTPGYVGADLHLVFKEAILNVNKKVKKETMIQEVTMEDIEYALTIVKASTQKGCIWNIDINPVHWEEIGGMEEIKRKIKMHIEWPLLYPKSFKRMGIPQPKGILLFGPPGCCKTTLIRAAATSCNATFLSVSSAQIYSPFVGDSEKAITELFHRARLGAPSMIFFDEIDTLVGKRSIGANHDVQEKVLSALLNEMDGIGIKSSDMQASELLENDDDDDYKFIKKEIEISNNSRVIVVAATNRPDIIDEAILRPGRFDVILGIPPPDIEARESILKIRTKKMPLENVSLRDLASRTEMFSGADLQNLCKEALYHAINENGFEVKSIKMNNFLAVLETMKPSLDHQQLQEFNKMAEKYNFTAVS